MIDVLVFVFNVYKDAVRIDDDTLFQTLDKKEFIRSMNVADALRRPNVRETQGCNSG